MSTYFVEFTAYVNERIRPEGFPHDIKIQETFENVDSTSHLQFRVNQRFIELASSAGLIGVKDPNKPLESGVISFDKRWYVPWHMFTHMGVRVTLIPASLVSTQDSLVPVDESPEKKDEIIN